MLIASHLNLSRDLILASLLGVLRQLVRIIAASVLGLGLAASVTSVARLARVLRSVAITRTLE